MARAVVAGFGRCRWHCTLIHGERCKASAAAVASGAVLSLVAGLRRGADFCSHMVALLALQRALWLGAAASFCGGAGRPGRSAPEAVSYVSTLASTIALGGCDGIAVHGSCGLRLDLARGSYLLSRGRYQHASA